MGTPEFAVPSLRAILDAGYTVPLVVSTPDRQKGRGLKTIPSDVKRFALEQGLEVATPESLKDPEFADRVRAANPDVICVVAFRILPESIYSIPRLGSFNLHGSLLPKYRGAAPINWAIINGERETGVTTFFLQRKVDTGNIILRKRMPIGPETTAGELHDAMMEVGAEAVVETLRRIEAGDVAVVPQSDEEATPAPKIFREDCRIDWNRPVERVHDFIRGLSPFPGAYTHDGDTLIKIFRCRPTSRPGLTPGSVLVVDGGLFIGTATGALEVTELQQEGRRSLSTSEFLRGYRFADDARLV